MSTVSSDRIPSLLITVPLYLHVFIFLSCFLQWYIHITSIELLQPSPTWGKQHKINKHRKIKSPKTKNPWWYLVAPFMLWRNFNWWESSNREMCLASSQWNTYSFNFTKTKEMLLKQNCHLCPLSIVNWFWWDRACSEWYDWRLSTASEFRNVSGLFRHTYPLLKNVRKSLKEIYLEIF